jgi:hypothetical protein
MDYLSSFTTFTLFIMPLAIVMARHRHRERMLTMRHRTLMNLVEKGAEIPANLLSSDSNADSSPSELVDLRKGTVLVCSGIGIALTLLCMPVHIEGGHTLADFWGVGILPVFMGIGYLGSWFYGRRLTGP